MILKTKIINLLTQNGKKASSEKLLKKVVKNLLKENKKNFKFIFYISINYSLHSFQVKNTNLSIQKKQSSVKIKPKPYFLDNKNKIIFGLKTIIKFSKKVNSSNFYFKKLKEQLLMSNNLKNDLVSSKINEQKNILNYQNILLFYRY